ncbi:polyadenylate-binding protein 1-A-like [Camellia sinensis]|uniref:polyadenylate-binding protein 1-A-like n=1 Tax=Camellia sinensis TaxID=4442 RepID=UPI0010364C21|nr:polyadenylate-binding protein 1-A-like [Camellia sinensis]
MITVFVDNLPKSIDPKSLFTLFNKFGVVKDVFIPNRRRKTFNTRFGFVRYDCTVAATAAIQKANGLWVDDRVLKVTKADFNSEQRRVMKQSTLGATNTSKQKVAFEGQGVQNNKGARKTFAEALIGQREAEFKHESHVKRLRKGKIRDGGGRDIVITFSSTEEKVEGVRLMQGWLNEWGEFVFNWKAGMHIE